MKRFIETVGDAGAIEGAREQLVMGPILTFDKSFLQMLSPDELDELDLQFEIFVTPVLVSEILAALAHPEQKPGQIPKEMVLALARKMVAGLLPRIKRRAPFCVSVTRLCMALCCCTALKFVTQRPTNLFDLQYLFYAPFGMVFVSHDKLQRDLCQPRQHKHHSFGVTNSRRI